MAPPVMMIGPSAPNGPPVPIEIAEDSGLSTATLAHPALADQNCLDGFRNSVAADLLRAEARHQPDRKSPHRRGGDHQPIPRGVRERDRPEADGMEPHQVGYERDGAEQHPGRGDTACADQRSHADKNEDAPVRGEIS